MVFENLTMKLNKQILSSCNLKTRFYTLTALHLSRTFIKMFCNFQAVH